jgi:hypothetical protein
MYAMAGLSMVFSIVLHVLLALLGYARRLLYSFLCL